MMTALDGVFAAGAIVRGASLVVWAVRDGRDAADRIHDYIAARADQAAAHQAGAPDPRTADRDAARPPSYGGSAHAQYAAGPPPPPRPPVSTPLTGNMTRTDKRVS